LCGNPQAARLLKPKRRSSAKGSPSISLGPFDSGERDPAALKLAALQGILTAKVAQPLA
jgi:hypothetical protein